MKRILISAVGILLAIIVWVGILVVAAAQGWTTNRMAPEGDWQAFAEAAIENIENSGIGNAGFALVRGGEVVKEHFTSIGKPMNRDTLFQMASVSKWVASWGVMKLVEEGKIDLDAPVDQYLARWHLPETEFDNSRVTVRRLLSHTSGLTDSLGYGGFETIEEVQTLEESLTKAADATGVGVARMGAPADGTWRYSGAGYTLMQLLIEELSGQSFNDYMLSEVFAPLGMSRSSYIVDRETVGNLADFYDSDGTIAIHYHYTALAAASLYTTTYDLARFLAAHATGPNGEPIGRGVLRADTLKSQRVPLARWFGMEVWGMGPALLAQLENGDWVVGHDGGNRPAINTTGRVDPSTGDGIVVLSSGGSRLASKLGDAWVYWQTGQVHGLAVVMAVFALQNTFLVGAGIILIVGVIFGWKYRRAPRATVTI